MEDANFIQIYGRQLDGHTAIESAHRRIFDTIYKGSHATFTLRNIRFLRPDVAIVFARAHVEFKEGNGIETRPTLIVVKEQSKCHVVAFQNTKISEVPAAAQAAAYLATYNSLEISDYPPAVDTGAPVSRKLFRDYPVTSQVSDYSARVVTNDFASRGPVRDRRGDLLLKRKLC